MRIIANDVSGSNWTAGSNPALSALNNAFAGYDLVETCEGVLHWQFRIPLCSPNLSFQPLVQQAHFEIPKLHAACLQLTETPKKLFVG